MLLVVWHIVASCREVMDFFFPRTLVEWKSKIPLLLNIQIGVSVSGGDSSMEEGL